MQQPTEIWRPVDGHPGYEVSNQGRVRSWRRTGGALTLADAPHFLKPRPAVQGRYLSVGIARRTRYVHHLIAAAFLGPRPDGLHIAHWDGNGHNNSVGNLRYTTRADNMADKIRHGTTNRGERCGTCKLSQEQVDEIRARYGPYRRYRAGIETQRSLAEEYGVSWQRIGSIVRGETWRYRADLQTAGRQQ